MEKHREAIDHASNPARTPQSQPEQSGRHFISFPAHPAKGETGPRCQIDDYPLAAGIGDYEWRRLPDTDIWTTPPFPFGLEAYASLLEHAADARAAAE